MNRETATEIANSWHELVRHDERIADEYHTLMGCLMALLPDNTDAAAGAFVETGAGVLALAGDALFVVTFQTRDDGATQPVVERLPLDPSSVTLRLRDSVDEKTPAGRNPFRGATGVTPAQVREWTVSWPGVARVTFPSIVRRFGGFRDGPDDAQGFGRELAARLGWALPE